MKFQLRRDIPVNVILMTGTPIQNDTSELYSLLSIVHPEKFPIGEQDEFVEKHSSLEAGLFSHVSLLYWSCGWLGIVRLYQWTPIKSGRNFARISGDFSNSTKVLLEVYWNFPISVDEVKDILKTYMIRRLKQDILLNLPPCDQVGFWLFYIFLMFTAIFLESLFRLSFIMAWQKNRRNSTSRFLCSNTVAYLNFVVVYLFVNADKIRDALRGKCPSLINVLVQLRKVVGHPYCFYGMLHFLSHFHNKEQAWNRNRMRRGSTSYRQVASLSCWIDFWRLACGYLNVYSYWCSSSWSPEDTAVPFLPSSSTFWISWTTTWTTEVLWE